MDNFYQILGVSTDAPQEEITRRYRFLVQVYHPDRFQESSAKSEAEEEMKKINSAYSVLSNSQKRSDYDRANVARSSPGNSSSSRTTESNPSDTEGMINYLQNLRTKWASRVTPFLEDKAITELVNLLQTGFFFLLKYAYPEKTRDEIRNVTDQFDNSMLVLILCNLSLGAEICYNNLPRGYSLNNLEDLSGFPLQKSIYETINVIQSRGVTFENIENVVENITKVTFALSKTCQSIGHDYAQNTIQSSSPSSKKEQEPRRSGNTGQSGNVNGKAQTQNNNPSTNQNYCQVCHQLSETQKVHLEQNIGVFIRRFHSTIEGYLCAECIEKYFWEFTGKTLLFGWWGLISCILSPFILLGNLIQYIRTREIRNRGSGLGEIARGWKVSTALTLMSVTILIFMLFGEQGQVNYITYYVTSTPDNIVSSNLLNVSSSTGSETIRKTPTTSPQMKTMIAGIYGPSPTPQDCNQWSEITISDKGKYLCATGFVRDAYDGGDIFYMTFGSRENDFRLIVLDGYYYPDVKGNCVTATGTVKAYGNMPYIEVSGKLYHCK